MGKGKYLRYYETDEQYQEERIDNYFEPWVSVTDEIDGEIIKRVNYNKNGHEKMLGTPLTFEISSPGNIVWCRTSTSVVQKTIQYKKNDGEWTTITSNTGNSAPTISVASGDTVQFRGDNAQYSTGGSVYNGFSGTTCGFKVKGNIMSLIDSDEFVTATTLQSAYTFFYLFNSCIGLTEADNLILPATTLTFGCYWGMFSGCTSLTAAPVLPATTLTYNCYLGMFGGCTNLTTAPELPATILKAMCYSNMFAGCTSLTTAPELPATTLADGCYQYMFNGCTSLTTAPELPAIILAESCYANMFRDCTSLRTAPELPATNRLFTYCYENMFYNCTNLNYIKCLATRLSATGLRNPTYNWVYGVASSGKFIKNSSMSGWSTGDSGIPDGWDVQDAS